MAWTGWFEWSGVEIINVERTEAYAEAMPWFKSAYKECNLGDMLGERYTNPVQDDAPWVDSKDENTYDFYGCYPLDVTGLEDSTATSAVVEGVLDGAVVGKPRRASRSIVFSLLLLGASEAAVEAGMRWLVTSLSNNPCGAAERPCVGDSLCFLTSAPCIDWQGGGWPAGDPTQCLEGYQRTIRNVSPTQGPTVVRKATMPSGGTAWIVNMTVVAGNPYTYGQEVDLVRHFMGVNQGADPYVGGAPEGALWDDDGVNRQDDNCWIPTYQPLMDPQCPAAILPPSVPSLPANCFDFPVNYRRRYFTIPAEFIPLWGDIVPKIELHTNANDVRQVRVRFYSMVQGNANTDLDPCSFCGDIIFSYVPADSTLIFDGSEQTIYVRTRGGPLRRADALVFGADGSPYEWPQLTCGYSYMVAVDTALHTPHPSIDLSLFARTA